MAPLKKLMIRTWRGPLPPWTPQFIRSVEPLKEFGWYFTIGNDWDGFRRLVKLETGVQIPEQIDTRKPGDYDPAYGEIFRETLKGYDFWGHFNLDCVYGRLSHFLPDNFLANIDIYGNDPGAVCGPFTIYRNCTKVNQLYQRVPTWREDFEDPKFHGWDEMEFNLAVRAAALSGHIRFVSGFLQAHDHMTPGHTIVAQTAGPGNVAYFQNDGALIDGVTGQEIMMYHFNQTRRWPIG